MCINLLQQMPKRPFQAMLAEASKTVTRQLNLNKTISVVGALRVSNPHQGDIDRSSYNQFDNNKWSKTATPQEGLNNIAVQKLHDTGSY